LCKFFSNSHVTRSDGDVHSGKGIKNVRYCHRRLRTKLQNNGGSPIATQQTFSATFTAQVVLDRITKAKTMAPMCREHTLNDQVVRAGRPGSSNGLQQFRRRKRRLRGAPMLQRRINPQKT
jgi:hypothetical protein